MNRLFRPPTSSTPLPGAWGGSALTTQDVVSGVVAPVVIIATSLSYSALIFSGPLAPYLPIGIGSGLTGAGLGAIVFALTSGLRFAVAAPDSKAIAVLASIMLPVIQGALTKGQMTATLNNGRSIVTAIIAYHFIVFPFSGRSDPLPPVPKRRRRSRMRLRRFSPTSPSVCL